MKNCIKRSRFSLSSYILNPRECIVSNNVYVAIVSASIFSASSSKLADDDSFITPLDLFTNIALNIVLGVVLNKLMPPSMLSDIGLESPSDPVDSLVLIRASTTA